MKVGSGIRTLQVALAGAGCLGLLRGSFGGAGSSVWAEEAGRVSVSIRHHHEGTKEDGGGCYRDVYHQHSREENCYQAGTCTIQTSGMGGFWSGDLDQFCGCHGNVHTVFQNVKRTHSSCGAEEGYGTISFTEYHGPGTSEFNGYDSYTHEYSTLNCSREGEVDGHELDCGEEEGAEVAVFTLTPSTRGWARELTLTAACEVKGNITLDGAPYIWNEGSPSAQAVFPVERNGIYTCRLNAGGNNNAQQTPVRISINNIDRTGPEITGIDFSREWTSGNVTVSVAGKDLQEDGSAGCGLAGQAFSFDAGGTWKGNSHTYTENGTYIIKVRDALGNVGEKSVVIANIDRTAPALHASMDQRANVRSNTITLSAQDLQPDGSGGSGLADAPWSFDGGKTWGKVHELEVRANAVITAAVRDAMGNVARTELTVNNIDTTPPEFTLSLEPEEWAPETSILVKAGDKNDAGMQGIGVDQYSYDGGKSWKKESSQKITENGTYQIRVKDALGNMAEDTITVTRVDYTAPEVAITYNTNTASEVRIVVTAKDPQPDGSAGSGLANRPYSFDGGVGWTSNHTHWVDENGDYPVWVKDRAGNIRKETVHITNMDHTGPTLIIRKTPDDGDWTTGEVTVQIAATDSRDDGTFGAGLAEYPYSYDEGKTWEQKTELILGENGDYPVWVKDQYGNITKETVAIRNIDVTPPLIRRVVCDEGNNLPRANVRVEAEDVQPDGSKGSGLAEKAYSFDGGKAWTDQNTHIHEENGTYEVLVRDRVGNVARRQYSVGNIDEYPPDAEKMEVIRQPEGWTRENVILIFSAEDRNPDGSEGSGLADEPWSYDGGETWQEENQCVAEENGVYRILVRDRCGNTAVKEVEVSNIDRMGPEVILRQKPLIWLLGEATINIEAKDIQPNGKEGCGLAKEAYSQDGENWSAAAEYQVTQPGDYTCYVRDQLGNVTEASITVKRAALPGGQTTEGGKNPDGSKDEGGSDNSGDSGNTGGSGNPDNTGSGGRPDGILVLPVPYPGTGDGTKLSEEPATKEQRRYSRKTDKANRKEDESREERSDEADGILKSRTEQRRLEIREEEADLKGDIGEMQQEECICRTHCEKNGREDCPVCRERPEDCQGKENGKTGFLPGWILACMGAGIVLLALILLPIFLGLAILFGTDEDGAHYLLAWKRIRREDGKNRMDLKTRECENDETGEYLLWCGLWGRLHEGEILEIWLENRVISEAIIEIKTGIRL